MNDMRQTSFPERKPLPTGETALRQKRGGLAWVSILLVLCLVAGMVPVFSQQTQVSAAASFSDHVIDTVTNMEGVTVNLFDYWVKNSNNGADGYRNTNEGINHNKELRFGSRTNDDQNYPDLTGNGLTINGFNGKIIEGIVEENLGGDGYPIIAEEKRFLNTSDHSLSYLFNPNDTSMENYRNTYENATGLFRIDDEGYYYYNANENYAEYDIDDNRFYVYNTWGVENNSQDTTDGQFFPFDPANEVFSSIKNSISQNGIDCTNSSLNHYFGFTLEAEFLQPANGNITIGDNSQPMTFEFSGDDDVWVFVDGVLVLDLGGIHNKAEGSINFATGEVITKSNVYNNNNDKGEQRTTILECFQNAGKSTEVGFKGNTFADNTYHTLSFFYLERGATASNMMLKFNLDTRPVNQIVKMDETGTPIEGITYELYEATVDANGTYNQKDDVLATLTTDEDGYATFLDEEGKPFEFNNDAEFELGTDGQYHFILKEIDVPSGYRSTGDIWLRFDPQTGSGGQLLVSNKWQTGAIANYSFVGTENSLDWANDRKPENGLAVDSIMENGTMFAVVLMKDTDGYWVPLYGNNRNGWQIQEPNNRSEADSVVSAVIEAAKQQNINHDGVICEQNVEGQWEVTLNELPGDITQYYYANMADPNSAKYIVAFYATSARSLNSAMASNTWLIDTSSFERKFSANIWIPNIRNMFQVQKLDQNGDPMNSGSVTYQLYESNGVTIGQDGTVTIKPNATPYDTATVQLTDANSVAVFGLDGNSNSKAPLNTDKTYYLVETSAPTGYVPSTQVVTIVVDDTGVHADAGISGDDVTVAVGVGYLLKPMEKFGANDAIDATLHDITGVVQTGTLNGSGNSIDWLSDNKETQTIHLNYNPEGALLQYSLTEGANTGITQPYLTYESGFGRLYIDQCFAHNMEELNKINIKEAINNNEYYAENGITPLFTGSTTVQIKNDLEIKTGSVTVSKTVTGLLNPDEDTFGFTIQFDGTTVPGTVNYTTVGDAEVTGGTDGTDGTNGTVAVTDNSIAFTLKNDDSVTFNGLPEGLQYTITESGNDTKYTYTTTVSAKKSDSTAVEDSKTDDDASIFTQSIVKEDTITVTYTNAVDPVKFDFTKVDGNSENNTPLDGAGFTLYQWNGTGDNTDLVNTETPGENWEEVNGGAVSGSTGEFNFDDLYCDATYRLVETTTPGGYIAPQGQWQLTYVGVGTQDSYNGWTIELITEDGALNKAPAFGVDGSTLYLPNYQVPEIPVTGGEGGGWMFYGLTGTLLVGGAVLTLFAFSRRRKHF